MPTTEHSVCFYPPLALCAYPARTVSRSLKFVHISHLRR